MTIRYSVALQNFLQTGGSFKNAFQNSSINLYQGTQPASGSAAATGALLCTITVASGALTNEVLATGGTTLVGSAGSVDTFTVNSLEIMGGATAFNTSLTQTAVDVCTKINNNPKNWLFVASSAVAVITITAKPGLGTLANSWAVSPGGSGGITFSGTANLSGGVLAVNGLKFNGSTAGTLIKDASQTWSGVGLAAAGTGIAAGWFRLCGSIADAQALDSSAIYLRLDGSIASSGADMTVSNATVVQGATFTLNTFSPTEPGTA